MPGIGVTCDANPMTRVMFYDDFTGPDNQATLDGYEYDYDKIWATMGRNGSNGILRNGFVEEGDPAAGWPVARAAGSIQRWDGFAQAYDGVEFWNTLTAYNLFIGNFVGDRVIFGALQPSLGVFFHLGTALASNPTYVVEVLTSTAGTGGTWSAVTPTKTPDFTQAGGYKNQRLEFPLPSTWPELTFGFFNESRWFWAIRLTSAAASSPQANVNFKDFLYGYFKYYGCAGDLQHGDDGVGVSSSDFRHEGAHHIRFRAGRGWKNRIGTGKVQIGTFDNAAERTGVRNPWVMTGTRAPTIKPAELFGGYVCGVGDRSAALAGDGILSGDSAGKGRIIATNFVGYANWQFGQSSGQLKKLDDMRVVKPNWLTTVPAIQTIVMVPGSTGPSTERLSVDCTPGAGTLWVVKSTISAMDPVVGLQIGGDDVSVAQIFKNTNAGGNWNFIRPWWGGPNKKWGANTVSSLATMHEFWYLTWRGYIVGGAPAQGIVVRAKDSTGTVQLIGTLDSNGQGSFNSNLSFAPSTGTIARNLFCVEDGGDGVTTNPLVRDQNMTIDINPADDPGFNPAYQSLTWSGKFARRYEYDPLSDSYVEHVWQRQDMEVQFYLPLACPSVPPPVAITSDQVPIAAAAEIRFEGMVPTIA